MREPEIGEHVTFTHELHRRNEPASPRKRRVWRPEERAKIESGIVVGIRTLSNGEIEYGWEDNPTVYYPVEHFIAYFVAYDIRRKPVYVLPEHTTREK